MENKEALIMEQQTKDLLAQTYHIDGRVTAIEGRLNQFGDQMNRIEQAIMNKPPMLNFGNVMSMLLAVAGLLYGINGFVDLRLAQVSEGIDRNEAVLDRIDDKLGEYAKFQREMHYEVGSFSTRLEEAESRRDRNENWVREIDARVRAMEQRTAAAEVSRRAIGDFVEDVDKYGSRRWIKPEGRQ